MNSNLIHPEHLGNTFKTFIIKFGFIGIREYSKIYGAREGQIVDASFFAKRDVVH